MKTFKDKNSINPIQLNELANTANTVNAVFNNILSLIYNDMIISAKNGHYGLSYDVTKYSDKCINMIEDKLKNDGFIIETISTNASFSDYKHYIQMKIFWDKEKYLKTEFKNINDTNELYRMPDNIRYMNR